MAKTVAEFLCTAAAYGQVGNDDTHFCSSLTYFGLNYLMSWLQYITIMHETKALNCKVFIILSKKHDIILL